jgi:hypothetical protein
VNDIYSEYNASLAHERTMTIETAALALIDFMIGEQEDCETIDKSYEYPGLGEKLLRLKRAVLGEPQR